ncbi:SusC/RagA family TonB-linked outer membrane protein [Bacteroidia bacterium]|nr:SusC/RagA family TonB-linked outer membrane protein [Bacteroidia bacterium]
MKKQFSNFHTAMLFAATMLFAGGGVQVLLAESPQEAKIALSGVVSDQDGPVIGASVIEKGNPGNGVATDVDGKFSLQVPSNATLQISYLGYATQEVAVNGQTTIHVTLKESASTLDEVVVTALGIKKEKKSLGYSVQDINSEEITKNKTANPLSSLAGKIAGVNITQSSGSAGAGAQIILRGGTSFDRDNQPVFVVDGVIFDNSTSTLGSSTFDGVTSVATTASNRVMDINPEDIENMSVLKGPAAAALYGSRAAAGVIVITTKKGKEGAVSVDVNSKLSTNWVNRFPEQQGKYKRGAYTSMGGKTEDTMDSWGDPFAAGEKIYNNIEDFFQNGSIWDNSVSVSGGSKNGSFYFSASNFSQTGIIPTTGYDKTTFRFNGDQKYGKLTVGANVAYSLASTNKTLTSAGLYGSSGNGAMTAIYPWPRSEDMKHYLNDDGTKYRNQAYNTDLVNDIENPYWTINKNRLSDRTERFTGSVNLDFKITDWWNVAYRAGTDSYTTGTDNFVAKGGALKGDYQDGMMSESEQRYTYLSSNLMTGINKTFGDFDLGLLLGTSTEDTKRVTNRRMGYKFTSDTFFSWNTILKANKSFEEGHSQKRMVSVYGEFRASYKNWAYFTVTERNDNTSTLPVDSRSYWYPSFSGSVVFSELLPKNDILSFGKLRASWAQVGKDAAPYQTNTNLREYQEFMNGTIGVINEPNEGGNSFLKPEITKSMELGLDVRFLNGRIGFDYTYYTNDSYNQLIFPRISNSIGFIIPIVNAGDLYNKGMELSITGQPIKTRDFTWEATLNFAGNRGRVANLLNGVEILKVTEVNDIGGITAAAFPDSYFMGLSGTKWDRAPDGKVILDAVSGMPQVSNNSQNDVGNREPKFTGGFNNSLQYKDWNLSFLWDFRKGGVVYNGTDYEMTKRGMSKRSEDRESLTIDGVINTGTAAAPVYENKTVTFDASTPEGRYAIQDYWTTYYTREASHFLTETNWLRLRAVSLSYTMPQTLLAKTKFIKGCTFTASGDNLLLFTNYKGMDPETSAAGSGTNGSSGVGIDYCSVPATSGFSFGVSLKF